MKKKVLTFCASLALLLTVSGGANAATVFFAVDFGLITAPDTVFSGHTITGSNDTNVHDDRYEFNVSPGADLDELTAVINAGVNEIDLTTFVVELFSSNTFGTADKNNLLATGVPRVGSPDIQDLSFMGLDPGVTYLIATTFMLDTGATAGQYTVQLTFTAVPIPPAAILFLSALAGLAGFSRIRRRKAVAT